MIFADTEGFVLAGGASSRMGADKAKLRLGEEIFAVRVGGELARAVSRVRVVSSRHQKSLGGFEVINDLYAEGGAFGGLLTALALSTSRWSLVVSCDLPFVTRLLFERLNEIRVRDSALKDGSQTKDEGARSSSEPFEIFAPRQADGRPQPLCALYSTEVCRDRARRLFDAGERRARAILFESRTRWIEFDEISDLPGASDFFFNVNTPADYERALAIYKRAGGS